MKKSFRATLFLGLLLAAAVGAPVATAGAAPPPVLPAPSFKSVSMEVLVAMDDGVQIAATVALPSKDGQTPLPGRFPVVVGMTPYGRNGVCSCFPPDFWATRGMVGAVADVRGTGGSGGTLEGNFFSPREARDSAAVIEYLGTQPYSTGKVGMAGGSYVGITQFLAAEQRPPHLAAIAPQIPTSDLYRDGFANGGIPSLLFDAQYVAVQGAPGAAGANNDPFLLEQTLKAKLGQSVLGTTAFDYLERPDDDPFYRDRSPIYRAGDIEVPALIIGGWRDGLSARGAPEMYEALARRRGVETRLFMTPCTHKGCGAPFAPLTDPPGQKDISAVVFEFLAEHLTDARTPDRPSVEYYLQPGGAFLSADRWPPASTRFQRLALEPGGLRFDGDPRPVGPTTAEYVTNPAAGFSLAFNKYGTVAGTPFVPTDQRLEGPNGLTFRTAAAEGPLDLVGPTALHLVARSTATDTDWYAKLSDVAADGSESLITEGALRASHRALDPAKSTPARPYHTHVSPQPIEPGRFYGYDIEIEPTAYRIAPGHRLQMRLTSLDLPTHLPGSIAFDRDRPLDTRIELNPPATNTVRFDGSYLTAPLVRQAPGHDGAPVPAPGPDGRSDQASRGGSGACLAARSAVGSRRVGPVRLGATRTRTLKRVRTRPVSRRHATYRWCVTGARGRVTAVFSSRSSGGRARLITTTSPQHRMRTVGAEAPLSRFRARFPNARRVARGIYRASSRSTRIFGVRRGRVRFVAVADRALLRDPRGLRRLLQRAGL